MASIHIELMKFTNTHQIHWFLGASIYPINGRNENVKEQGVACM